MQIIIIFVVSLIIALLGTRLTRKLATKLQIGAYPDERRVHKGFIPIMGGFGIYAGFLSGIVLSAVILPGAYQAITSQYSGLIIASVIIVALGVYDDIKGLNAPRKFIFQFIAVSAIILFDCTIRTVNLPFGIKIELGLLSVPITYLWLIGISNAVNLLDGLDGLAAGVGIIVTSVFLIIGWQNGDAATIVVSVSLIAGLLGFMRYNYHPATIFMGDTGSLFLGLALAGLSLRAFETSSGSISLVVPVLALAIPIGDTSVAFFRRLNRGRHPFKPDKDHLHHRLIYLGLSHRQAVHIIYFGALLYALTAFFVFRQSTFYAGILLIFAVLLSFFGLKRIGYLESQRSKTYYGDTSLIKARREVAPLSMGRFLHKMILLISDVISINIALYLSWYLRFHTAILPGEKQLALNEVLFSPAAFSLTLGWIILFILNDLYKMYWDVSRFDKVQRVIKVIIFGILALFLITIDPQNIFSSGRITLLIYGALLVFFVNFGRLIIIGLEKRLTILEYSPHNTLLVGATQKGRKLLKDINQNPHLLYNVIGYVTEEGSDKKFSGLPCLGRYNDIANIIRDHGVEEIIIAINERSRDEILNIVASAEYTAVSFKLPPQIYDVVSGHKTEEVIGHPLIRLFPERMRLWQWFFKRLFDLTASLSLMLVISPLALFLMVIQLISGISPVVKIENVVGRNGNIFGMLNFAVSGAGQKGSPFIGRLLYRTRFYKLPALINILMGKMSFVGPRPEDTELVEQLTKKIKFYNRRFQIRPGLTGWAQVKFRYEESLKHKREQLKQDLFYLENMSLSFDIRILLRSAVIFLLGR